MFEALFIILVIIVLAVFLFYAPRLVAFLMREFSGFQSATFSEIKPLVWRLLNLGSEGSYFAIYNRDNAEIWFRFRKYVKDTGDQGIELCIDCDSSSRNYVQEFRGYCKKNGIPSRLFDEAREKPAKLLCADFAGNTNDACEHFGIIIQDIAKAPIQGEYRYHGRP